MKSINANEASSQFKSLLETVQHEPVEIKRYGKPIAVILSRNEYENLHAEKIKLEMECLKMRLDLKDTKE
ncbi:type II toxin-antitoxin system Phd/YefM family antitoxin [Vibrio alfacsensis]|uniref:type II toxin-antitoxin system Phd/YefM family antitoxin n=1 Tax=Vibrio alfacsensis TaxID=1074311 RepID=UPI00406890A1